jgi:hypothetical protein
VTSLILGVLAGQVHMGGGMLIHELSVLLVIVNAVCLRRQSGIEAVENVSTRRGSPYSPLITGRRIRRKMDVTAVGVKEHPHVWIWN